MRQHAARSAVFFAAALAIAFTLTACSSGGGGDDGPDPADLLRDALSELGRNMERYDSLVTPGLHLRHSISISDINEVADDEFFGAECSGTQCAIENLGPEDTDGTQVDLLDLIDPTTSSDPESITLGSRGGFDTLTVVSDLNVAAHIRPDVVFVMPPSATSLGFWGEHGFAGVAIGNGPLSGRISLENIPNPVPFDGRLQFALAYAMGAVTGSNPPGTGGATWEGIVEAASTLTFVRRTGTATVIIGDLSNPSASVNIEVDGSAINPQEWANVPIMAGGFKVGTVAEGNLLEGNFHGPMHEETYGVFDTTSYTGAFGAKRRN